MGKARRIAIVGAGLGGLATAIALRQRGFEVQVHEQAPELGEFGAGINISPNSVKFFDAIGLTAKLQAVASEPVGLTWRAWDADEISYSLPFGDFEKRYGAKYYVVHRSDLHRLLSEAVPQSSIQLGKRCTAVETRNGTAGLSFADGSSAEADVVVGCDGIRSAVRACHLRRRRPALRRNDVLAGAGAERCAAEELSRRLREPMVGRRRLRRQLLHPAGQVHQLRLRAAAARLDRAIVVGAEQRRRDAGGVPQGRPEAAPDDGGRDVVLEMGPVHRRARPAVDQGPRHPAGRFRARHAGDLRARRQHGVRGRLCSGAMARSQRRRSGRGAGRLRSGAQAPGDPSPAIVAHRSRFQENPFELGPPAPRIRLHDAPRLDNGRRLPLDFGYDPVAQWRGS